PDHLRTRWVAEPDQPPETNLSVRVTGRKKLGPIVESEATYIRVAIFKRSDRLVCGKVPEVHSWAECCGGEPCARRRSHDGDRSVVFGVSRLGCGFPAHSAKKIGCDFGELLADRVGQQFALASRVRNKRLPIESRANPLFNEARHRSQ